MFTRLRVAWWALLGRPIIYKVNIGGKDWTLTYHKSHGPLFVAECVLGNPAEPMFDYSIPAVSFTAR